MAATDAQPVVRAGAARPIPARAREARRCDAIPHARVPQARLRLWKNPFRACFDAA